ncbi:MAG: hypothetical protein IE909_11925 [Campylobacterales bacterium]|nr:hypothetical protein [Campylobacterales bacterium]
MIANFLILVGMLSFILGLIASNKFSDNVFYFLTKKVFPDRLSSNKSVYFVVFGILGFLVFYINDFSVAKVLFRGLVEDEVQQTISLNQSESLIFNSFLRPMPLILLAIYFYAYNQNLCKFRGGVYESFVLFIFFIISIFLVFPTSISRFQVAALYIPMLILFTNFWDKPYRMQITILSALLIVFPFLEKFRRFNPETFSWKLDMDFLNHGHFDAYQNFVRVLENDFITYGNQLLGVVLFFIPRTLWETKPIGSGAALAESIGLSFSNISMPFLAEGYVNMGVLGVFTFMFVLGYILNLLDSVAWKIKSMQRESLFLYYYYFLFGMIFFMMRGDLMSSFAFTLGLTVSFFFLVYLLKLFKLKFKF